jgi:aminoglycoside 6'-N-acetyltransferase
VEQRIVGDRVVLRRATERDLPVLLAILEEPSVSRWWQGSSRTELEELVRAPSQETTVFVVEVDEAVVGLLYATEEPHPDYRHAGIDITLRTDAQGQGLGTDAVRTLARWLVEQRGHHRLTIDPAADNEVAIACYRKVGFRPVGVMRRYERRDDGRWHDGLLMDLLADELT